MPQNVLLIDTEPVIPSWLRRRDDSISESVVLGDDDALGQDDATATAEQDAIVCCVDRPAPPTEPLMSPTQALTTHFDIDTGGDQPGKSGKTAPRGSDELRQGFKVGELCFMIRNEDASELSEVPAMHRLPNAPDWFFGIANMHGKLIPVFDLARYLVVDHDPQAKRMLLVLARGRDAGGVLIDGLPERLRWTNEGQADADTAPERLTPHLRGISLIGERLWFDLDTRSLLDQIEQSLAKP